MWSEGSLRRGQSNEKGVAQEALAEVRAATNPVKTVGDPVAGILHALEHQGNAARAFQRREYMAFYPRISTATATRDLKEAASVGRLRAEGCGRSVRYQATS